MPIYFSIPEKYQKISRIVLMRQKLKPAKIPKMSPIRAR